MKNKIATQSMAIFFIVILLSGTTSSVFNFDTNNSDESNMQEAYALQDDVKAFSAMKNAFKSILGEKLQNPLESGWLFDIANTYEEKYQSLAGIVSQKGKASIQNEAEKCLKNGLDGVVNMILSPEFEKVNTAAELDEFLKNNVDASKAIDELYSCVIESETVTDMKTLLEHADEIIIVHFALEKNSGTVSKIDNSKFAQVLQKYSNIDAAELERNAIATSALLSWISLKTALQEYHKQNLESDEHVAFFSMTVSESEFKSTVKTIFDELVSEIDDPKWLTDLKGLLETYKDCKNAALALSLDPSYMTTALEHVDANTKNKINSCVQEIEKQAVLLLEALLYTGSEVVKEYADFWKVVAWYLNIAPYYDQRWNELTKFVLDSPEIAEQLLVDTATCFDHGSNAMSELISALPQIKQLLDQGDIDIAKLTKFANEHKELSDGLAKYAECSADIDERLDEIKQKTKDADEVLVVHLALVTHDYGDRVSGISHLVDAASEEASIDFETLRRDGVAFNTLVGWIILKTISGSNSGQVTSEVADQASSFAKMFGKKIVKEQFKDQIISSFKSSSKDVPLPYYVKVLKETTNGFGECIPKIISINEFGSCIKSLEDNLNKLAEPFVKIEKGIRECNESPESKKRCEDHFNNKFGPPLSNIADKVTLLGDCVTFEGNDKDCSSLLEIDERTYKSIRVCAQPGHDVECLEVLKGVYTDIAKVADQIIEDIDKEAKIVIAKIDECTKSDEGFTKCAKELGLSDETIAQINQCKSSGTEAIKCYESASGVIQNEISAASTVVFNAVVDCMKDPATREDCAKNFGVSQETIDKINACAETPMTAVSCYDEAKDVMSNEIANAAAPVIAAVVDCMKDPATREDCAKNFGVSQETIDKINACAEDPMAAVGCYEEAKGIIDDEIVSAAAPIIAAVVDCMKDPATREDCAKSLGISQETIDKVNSCTESATNALACYQEADAVITKEKEALSKTVSEAFNKVKECTETVDNLEKCALQLGISSETFQKIDRCTRAGSGLSDCFDDFSVEINIDVSAEQIFGTCPSGTTDSGVFCTKPAKCPSGFTDPAGTCVKESSCPGGETPVLGVCSRSSSCPGGESPVAGVCSRAASCTYGGNNLFGTCNLAHKVKKTPNCSNVDIPKICTPRICAPAYLGGGCTGGDCTGGGTKRVCGPDTITTSCESGYGKNIANCTRDSTCPSGYTNTKGTCTRDSTCPSGYTNTVGTCTIDSTCPAGSAKTITFVCEAIHKCDGGNEWTLAPVNTCYMFKQSAGEPIVRGFMEEGVTEPEIILKTVETKQTSDEVAAIAIAIFIIAIVIAVSMVSLSRQK